MSENSTNYPELEQVIGAYFHQDAYLDDPTDTEIWHRILDDSPEHLRVVLVYQLDDLLRHDAEVIRQFWDARCDAFGFGDPGKARAYVTAMRDTFARVGGADV